MTLPIEFDDAIVLGQRLAALLRVGDLPPAQVAALRRVYDQVAQSGAADWSHDGIPRISSPCGG